MLMIYIILIMIGLMSGDQLFSELPESDHLLTPWLTGAGFAWLYLLSLLLGQWSLYRLRRGDSQRRVMRQYHRISHLLLIAGIGTFYISVFALGWLDWIHALLKSICFGYLPILLDLWLAALPPLLLPLIGWWSYFPVDVLIREQRFETRLNLSQRLGWIGAQMRFQMLPALAPLLLLMLWSESWALALTQLLPRQSAWFEPTLSLGTLCGAVAIFISAPLVLRVVFNTVVMPEGPVKQMLMDLCRQASVRISHLMIWRTGHRIINAAVIGPTGRLRYVLLTDALLDQLPEREIQAVMGHELGHVRRRHMIWLILCAIGCLALAALAIDRLSWAIDQWLGENPWHWLAGELDANTDSMLSVPVALFLLLVGTCWMLLFGICSRRYERQADVFACQLLAERYGQRNSIGQQVIGADAVMAMANALTRVGRLNHVPLTRHSWRHGSLSWRIEYLMTLIGRPIDTCSIDREIAAINGLVGLSVLVGLYTDLQPLLVYLASDYF